MKAGAAAGVKKRRWVVQRVSQLRCATGAQVACYREAGEESSAVRSARARMDRGEGGTGTSRP